MKSLAWRTVGILLLPFAAPGGEGLPDLLPPHSELPPSWWDKHGWLIIAAAILTLMAVALLTAFLCRRRQPPETTPPGARARVELEALRGAVEDDALLVRVSGILRRYLLHVCGLPPAELTTGELREAVQSSPRLNPGLASDINGFLKQCDEWKFAPASHQPPPLPAAQKTGAVNAALALMDKIEQSRKPPTVAPSQPAAPAPAP